MADYITAIRTAEGDKKIDYNALANKPTNMTPKSHADTHKIDGSDPLWTATTSKAGLMSSNDKKKLDAVDSEKIDAINALTQYTWKRRKQNTNINTSASEIKSLTAATYVIGGNPTYGVDPYQEVDDKKVTIYYASKYSTSVNSSDKVVFALTEPASFVLPASTTGSTALDVVKGKYWYTGSSNLSEIYYTPADASNATFTGPIQNGSFYQGNAVYAISAQTLTGEFTVGTWEWVYSDDENAYPYSGTKSGYEYIGYGGFDNRQTSAVFDTGYYIGTGTVGSSGKNSITFPFVPKYVVVSTNLGGTSLALTFLNPLTSPNVNVDTFSNFVYWKATWSNKTLSWYIYGTGNGADQADNQLNATGTKYYYVAWG